MKNLISLLLCLFSFTVTSQTIDSTFVTPANRDELMKQLVGLPCGILPTDEKKIICQKIEKYLTSFKYDPNFPDDKFAKVANWQALKSVKMGGYGIDRKSVV